jgi:chromate reductase
MEEIKVLGIVGSLRKNSYNKMLLRAAQKLAPKGMIIESVDLEGFPPFNQDYEENPPQIVKEFKNKIRSSDALLIVTPEYNYSVPGVLKNAIDWASRPYYDNVFNGKPVGLMSASTGMIGGARAQYHLRQIFVFLNMYPVNRPEVIVTFAPKKFSPEGELIDEDARKFIIEHLNNLMKLTKVLKMFNSM